MSMQFCENTCSRERGVKKAMDVSGIDDVGLQSFMGGLPDLPQQVPIDPLTFMVGSIEVMVNGEGGGPGNIVGLEAGPVAHTDVPSATGKRQYQP